MYSREERMKAIELYIKYDKSIAAVIHELGYPSRGLLPRWYKAYLKEQETGVLWERYSRCPRFSPEQLNTMAGPKRKGFTARLPRMPAILK